MSAFSRRKAIVGLVVPCMAALGATHALGATEAITTSPGCCAFSKGAFTIDLGQVATFQNLDGVSHDVFASGKGPDGAELFRSDTISSGQAPVHGTQYLAPGNYPFICTIHSEMSAQLAVTANGTPAARPDFELKVLSSSLDRVVSSGKLKLKVSATTESDDVSVTARKGARKLGSKRNLDLAAGASRIVKLRLTSAAENALEDLGSAKVKVTGTVPFGSPATAKRKLN
jgi:plastocyanin